MTITINQDMLNRITDDKRDQWDGTITFSIDVDPGSYGSPFESYDTLRWSAADRTAMIEVAEYWDDVIARDISYVFNNDEEDIIINKTNGLPTGTDGIAYTTLHSPFPDDADIFLRRDPIVAGTATWITAMHEFGHALGLQHPGDYDASDGGEITYANSRDYDQDTVQFSIMSYFAPRNYTPAATWGTNQPLTPMIYDILAIQAYYGVDTTTRLGDTTYGFNSTAGRGVFAFDASHYSVFTIWDAGGSHDRLDASLYGQAQRIDLSEGSYSDIGGQVANIGIAFGTFIEDAIGGTGDDRIDGNAFANVLDGGTGAGADGLYGKGGDDALTGGDGDDILYGDAGNDTLVGGSGADLINGGAGFDTAEYGAAGGERITLRPVTGNPALGRWSVTGAGQATGDILAQIEAFRFGEVNDTITGASTDPAFEFNLDGRGGNDVITGSIGRDTLIGGLGTDSLRPGAGVFQVFGGAAGPLGTWTESAAQNDELVVDRSSLATGYYLRFVGAGGTYAVGYLESTVPSGGDGSFARGIHRLNFTGGSGADTVGGGLGRNVIAGAGGNDQLYGNLGRDTLLGGIGKDYLQGDAGNDVLDGGTDLDTLVGGAGDDTLLGGAGYDVLDGGAGNDRIETGGGGDLAVYGEGGDDVLIGAADAESFYGGIGNDAVSAGAGNDTLRGDDGNDTLAGGEGSDLIYTGIGADVVNGGEGFDRLEIFRNTTAVGVSYYLNGVAGSDGARSTGIESFAYYAGTGNDTVQGAEAGDYVSGDAGNDRLEGLGGNDTLGGGIGNDTLLGGPGGDNLSGGEGNDRIETGGGGELGVYGEGGDDVLIGAAEAEGFYGGTGNDAIVARAGNDTLRGDDGNDTLSGGEGSDLIYTGIGADVADGGEGFDRLEIFRNTTAVGVSYYLNGAAGSDGARSIGIESFAYYAGTGNDTVRGAEAGDYLSGDVGNDRLEGLAGNDTLSGGVGNDTLLGGLGGDNLSGGEGNDRIETGGGGELGVYGEGGDDVLIGAAEAEGFYGGTGNDAIAARNGNDTLRGDDGNDTLAGGEGDDLLYTGMGADVADGGEGFDRLEIFRNTTTVGVSYYLNGVAGSDGARSIGIESFAYYAGTGNDTVRGAEAGDYLSGDAGNDRLEGLAGNDTLGGGTGNDTLLGGLGYDYLSGGEGDDRIETGGGADLAVYGEGGDDVLIGAADAESFYGGTGNDAVSAGAGNDTLRGDDGNDTLAGGEGNDLIYTGIGADVVNGGEGVDRLEIFRNTTAVGVSYYLNGPVGSDGARSLGIESFAYYAGTGNDTVRGAEAGDYLSGDAGNDRLEGLAGNDTLSGAAGDDTLLGGLGYDNLSGGEGNDRIETGGGGDLAVYGEGGDDVLIGAADAESFYGGTGNDAVSAGAGNDTLRGDDGNDKLTGGTGADLLYGGTGTDRFIFASGAGTDTIADFDADAAGGQDLVDLVAFGYGTYAGMLAAGASLTQVGGDARLDLGVGGAVITFQTVSAAALNGSDFLFA